MSNLEIVNRIYELFATRTIEAIRPIFDKQVRWNMMRGFPGGGRYVGIDEVFEQMFPLFSRDWTN